jgi:NAD+ kinase
MLKTITLVGASEIPIIGINTGRLGFLSGISIDEIESAWTKFLQVILNSINEVW